VIAIDTNIVVRFIVQDDPGQYAAAVKLISTRPVLLLKTVLLEAEWVLRKVYRNTPVQIGGALKSFVALENVHAGDREEMFQSLDAYEKGMDFADAMHLVQSARSEGFATFDASLKRSAKRIGGFVPVMVP
jgi:predicted nucleic-acid-binding protein